MTALAVLAVFILGALVLGLLSRRGKDMDLEQWSVAGRGFGALFVFLLMAGEIYSTFTFLGASGQAYGQGGPAYYILSYGTLAYALSYWLLPAIWRIAKREGFLSQSDFYSGRYNSRPLGVLVAAVGVVAMVPYLVLQLQGLGIIVSAASYGQIGKSWGVAVGAVVLAVYVTVSGIHGSAWTSVAKDVLILLVVVVLGSYLPVHFFGGVSPMFHAVEAAKPGALTLPASGSNPTWFASTVLLSAAGFYMWPHSFAASYSASNERVFRRNAVFLPLYQLVLLLVLFVGFAAVVVVPGLHDRDMALLEISARSFPPWFVGVIGGTGVLTALVPGSLLLTTSATCLARNLFQAARPSTSADTVNRLARACVPVLALIAMYFAISGSSTIVSLLLMGYALVAQLFPALLAGLPARRRVSAPGAIAGIVVGVALVVGTLGTGTKLSALAPWLPRPVLDVHVGIFAVVVNAVVMLAVSAVTRKPAADAEARAV